MKYYNRNIHFQCFYLNKILIFITLIFITISCLNDSKDSFSRVVVSQNKKDVTLNDTLEYEKLCGIPKYFELYQKNHFHLAYFDFEEGMLCAKELKRPVLLMFDAWGAKNARKMQEVIFSDPDIISFINKNFIAICLYVDDRTKLPKEEQHQSSLRENTLITTIGLKNNELQIKMLKNGSQPSLVVLDNEGAFLSDIKTFSLNKKTFIDWLISASNVFDNTSPR